MDALNKVNVRDRKALLAASTDRLLGMIMRLNRRSCYHNTLDAIALTSRLMELKDRGALHDDTLSSPKDTVPS